jgi:adenosine deaminase
MSAAAAAAAAAAAPELSQEQEQSFACRLPKIELHAHLTGSISRKCLHDIWQSIQGRDSAVNLQDPLVAIPSDKVDYDLETYGPSTSQF